MTLTRGSTTLVGHLETPAHSDFQHGDVDFFAGEIFKCDPVNISKKLGCRGSSPSDNKPHGRVINQSRG